MIIDHCNTTYEKNKIRVGGALRMDGGWLPLPTRPQRYCDPRHLFSFYRSLASELTAENIELDAKLSEAFQDFTTFLVQTQSASYENK